MPQSEERGSWSQDTWLLNQLHLPASYSTSVNIGGKFTGTMPRSSGRWGLSSGQRGGSCDLAQTLDR